MLESMIISTNNSRWITINHGCWAPSNARENDKVHGRECLSENIQIIINYHCCQSHTQEKLLKRSAQKTFTGCSDCWQCQDFFRSWKGGVGVLDVSLRAAPPSLPDTSLRFLGIFFFYINFLPPSLPPLFFFFFKSGGNELCIAFVRAL